MRKPTRLILAASAVATVLSAMTIVPVAEAASKKTIEEGKELSFDRKKGNCLACHAMAGGNMPGNIGPPLIAMKARFPDKAKLRAQIWDATVKNPDSMMPPFGKHKVVSESDIDKIVEYIYTL